MTDACLPLVGKVALVTGASGGIGGAITDGGCGCSRRMDSHIDHSGTVAHASRALNPLGSPFPR